MSAVRTISSASLAKGLGSAEGHLRSYPPSLAMGMARPARRCLSARRSLQVLAKRGEGEEATQETGLGLKAVWYGAEAFGRMIGRQGKGAAPTESGNLKTYSREDAIAAIRSDYDSNYFISGEGEMAAYDQNCVFADPFVSFAGTDRFRENVANLGGLMSDVKLNISDFSEAEDGSVVTSWSFSCVLDLPWRPRLAAAGGTTHVFGPSGKVVKHVERWAVDPSDVVVSLLKPSSKIPTSRLETFMSCLSVGDGWGCFGVLSPILVKYTAPVVGLSLLFKATSGDGFPGSILGTIEGLSYLGLVTGLGMEGKKLLGGFQGGETGTGGRF